MWRARLRQAFGPPGTLWWLATSVGTLAALECLLRQDGLWQHPLGQGVLAGLAGVFNLQPSWLGGATVQEGLRHFVESGLVALPVVFLMVRPFGVESYHILSHSMEPTLYGSQDRVLVNKLAYWLGPPRRHDIVVLTAPPQAPSPGETLIKRIIGLPGETVQVKRGRVSIRSAARRREELVEPYLKEPPAYHLVHRVPENAYFVLGDNRNHSQDSHVWGSVPAELVRGKAWLIFWPPRRIRRLG